MGTNGNTNILHGPEELWTVPDVTVGTYIIDSLKQHGDKIAMIHGISGESATYTDILTKSLSVAEALRLRGVKSGHVIGICSENNLEYCLASLGVHFVGAVCAPLNPLYTNRELIHSLTISKPILVFCSPLTAGRIEEVTRQQDAARDIVVFGSTAAHNHIPFSSFLLNKCPDVIAQHRAGNDRVAAVLSSSGTTGLPKGVMITDRNIITAVGHLRDERFAALKPDEILLAILPFFHAYGYILQIANLCLGQQIIVLPKFVDTLFLNAIQTYKVTMLALVPPLVLFLAKHPLVAKYDVSSVRNIWCSAAPLSQELQTLVTKRISVKHVRQAYGMTETTLAVTLTPNDWNKVGSSGKLAPGTLCKVVDLDSGQAVPANVRGELCFHGPLTMKGYMGDPQASAASFDQDGFYHTGDIGYYDEDGFFFIVDRLKELIKYKGFQVPPAELEAILLTHASIKDAAVIGIPDEAAGELPLAFVVLQPGQSLTEEEVCKFVADQVSPQKKLRGGVRFVDVVPKSPSGKILHRELREIVAKELNT